MSDSPIESTKELHESKERKPEMKLKMTSERLAEKIQSDPDVETEAGILHPEASRTDFRTALDLFGDAKFALGAWSGDAHGGKPYSKLNDAANAAFDRVMEMHRIAPPRGEAEIPTESPRGEAYLCRCGHPDWEHSEYGCSLCSCTSFRDPHDSASLHSTVKVMVGTCSNCGAQVTIVPFPDPNAD